jgi:hypothetical protein
MPTATSPRRDGRPWLPLVAFLIGVLTWSGGVIAYRLWFTKPEPLTEYEHLMADGSILEVEAITIGTDHNFTYHRPRSMRSIVDLLFPWWRPQTLPVKISYGCGVPQIMVWLSRRDAQTGRPLDFNWWRENVVVDVAGNAISHVSQALNRPQLYWFSRTVSGKRTGTPPLLADHASESAWILLTAFPPFRSQADRMRLTVKNATGDVVAEFDLPHPATASLPEWQAEPLPKTFTAGDLALTVSGIQCQSGEESSSAQPDMALSWQGKPTTDWEVTAMSFTSPLGTKLESTGAGATSLVILDAAGRAVDRAFGFDDTLRRERLWKMSLACIRGANAAFADFERGGLEGIPLQEADTADVSERRCHVHGCALAVVAVGGAGAARFPLPATRLGLGPDPFSRATNCLPFQELSRWKFESRDGTTATVSCDTPFPWLILDRSGVPASKTLQVRVRDDQGREVKAGVSPLRGELTVLFLQPKPDTKAVSLDVTIQDPVVFEAIVELPPP